MLSRRRCRDLRHQFRSQAAANRISSQRQRQAGHFLPPPAQIDDAMQSRLVVGELSFVDDQAGLVLAFEHLRDDLVEGHDLGFNAREQRASEPDRRWSWFRERQCVSL